MEYMMGSTIESTQVGGTAPNGAPIDLPVRFRDFAEGDKNFVLANWLRSNRNNDAYAAMRNEHYFYDHQLTIGDVAQNSPIRVCCSVDDPNVIYGFICFRPREDGLVVHYIFVKQAFKRLKLAAAMLHDAGWRSGMAVFATAWNFRLPPVIDRFNIFYRPRLLVTVHP